MFRLNVYGVDVTKKNIHQTVQNLCRDMEKTFMLEGFQAVCCADVANLDSMQLEINLEITLDNLTVNLYKSKRLFLELDLLLADDDENPPMAAFKYKDTVIVPFTFKTIVEAESASEYLSPAHLALFNTVLDKYSQAIQTINSSCY